MKWSVCNFIFLGNRHILLDESSQSQERLCCEWHDHQMSYMYTKHFTGSIRKGREREFGRKTAREGELTRAEGGTPFPS